MTEVRTAPNTELMFEKQFNGYDKGQVDSYVSNLAEAYQSVFDEYTTTSEKYSTLLSAYKALEKNLEQRVEAEKRPEAQERSGLNSEIIAKMLTDAESLAQKAISDAKTEAAKITVEAHVEAKRIADDAYIEKAAMKLQAQALSDEAEAMLACARDEAQKIAEETRLTAAAAKDMAQRILDGAQLEAARITMQAQKDRDQANEILRRSVAQIQTMLLPAAAEAAPVHLADSPMAFSLQALSAS